MWAEQGRAQDAPTNHPTETLQLQASLWATSLVGCFVLGSDSARRILSRLPLGQSQISFWFWFCGFFIFIFYIFVFYKNIFLIWKFTGIYPGRPAAGRPATGWQGHFWKKFRGENCAEVPGGRSPGSGAAGPGRPAAGRPDLPPLYKGWLVPHPSFASLKF